MLVCKCTYSHEKNSLVKISEDACVCVRVTHMGVADVLTHHDRKS